MFLFKKKITYNGVPCIFCNCIPYGQKYAISDDLAQWLWRNIKNYDLLHIHSVFSYSSTVAMSIARFYQIPYIIRPLGQICEWSLKQNDLIKKSFLNIIGYQNINNAKAIHFTTEQEKKEAKYLNLKPQSIIIPLGIETNKKILNASEQLKKWLNISDNAPIILFLSRIHPKKGLSYLIPALGKISHKYPFHFIIAGDGKEDYKQQIIELIETYQLKNRTYLVGFVQGEKKQILLQGSDLFALTSHSENFGVVVLEAMAIGLPVLLTPGVALSGIVKEHRLGYVSNLDSDSITESLTDFLRNRDSQEIQVMGERAKKYIDNNYLWDIIAKKIITAYQQIFN